ncbi:hypothetical protein E2C01_068030 [Portunus trituberculatus]|uniref:Uncharacterized protein n=1 Tax=Portunus trituberculatus TaxID=210409 RepID=A0A5B7HZ02_PORTR|nr:hypothetical protein [Portunus trituberculatus]
MVKVSASRDSEALARGRVMNATRGERIIVVVNVAFRQAPTGSPPFTAPPPAQPGTSSDSLTSPFRLLPSSLPVMCTNSQHLATLHMKIMKRIFEHVEINLYF